MGSHRDDFGGKTSITLDLPSSRIGRLGPTATQLLDEAMTAVRCGRFERALELLPTISDSSHSYAKRQVTMKALQGLGRHDELIQLLNPPQNADEAVRVVALLVGQKRFEECMVLLESASDLLDPATHKALADQISVERTLS